MFGNDEDEDERRFLRGSLSTGAGALTLTEVFGLSDNMSSIILCLSLPPASTNTVITFPILEDWFSLSAQVFADFEDKNMTFPIPRCFLFLGL